MNYQNMLLAFSEQAILYHTRAYGEQSNAFRKHSGLPYFVHVTDVMKRVARYGVTFENASLLGGEKKVFIIQAGAVGHDLKEDTHADLVRIAAVYGQEVVDLISECTREEGDGATRPEKWKFLMSFLEKSPESVIIKIADRYCNVMDYMERSRHYAAWYALQAAPLYQRFVSDYQRFPKVLREPIDRDITQLQEIVSTRFSDVDIVTTRLEEIEGLVT